MDVDRSGKSVKAIRRHRLADVHHDSNEEMLIEVAEKLGGRIMMCGPLDFWLWHPRLRCWFPVEVKRPEREGSARQYTKLQLRFFRWCQLNNAPWHIWRTEGDVLATLGAKVTA
jgi:hypothetical protein